MAVQRISVKSRKKRPSRYKSGSRTRTVSRMGRSVKNRVVPIQRNIYGFPDNYVATLRYCDNITLSSAIGAIGKNTFRMNSIFDPDYTGTGHQPLYHDQFAGIFNKYVVIGSKIKVTFANVPDSMAATAPTGPIVVGLCPDTDTTLSSVISTVMEAPKSINSTINNGLGQSIKILSATYSPQRDLGLTPEDDTIGANFGSNPSLAYYMHVWCADVGSGQTADIIAKVEIEYAVRFKLLIDVAQS